MCRKQKELRERRTKEREEKERLRREALSVKKEQLMKTKGYQRLLAQACSGHGLHHRAPLAPWSCTCAPPAASLARHCANPSLTVRDGMVEQGSSATCACIQAQTALSQYTY